MQYYSFANPTPTLYDKSYVYISRAKYPNYAHLILDWKLHSDILTESDLSSYEYIKFGKLMSSVMQEEIAFQCFYMAYLKNPSNMKTNSELPFETYNPNLIDN